MRRAERTWYVAVHCTHTAAMPGNLRKRRSRRTGQCSAVSMGSCQGARWLPHPDPHPGQQQGRAHDEALRSGARRQHAEAI